MKRKAKTLFWIFLSSQETKLPNYFHLIFGGQ